MRGLGTYAVAFLFMTASGLGFLSTGCAEREGEYGQREQAEDAPEVAEEEQEFGWQAERQPGAQPEAQREPGELAQRQPEAGQAPEAGAREGQAGMAGGTAAGAQHQVTGEVTEVKQEDGMVSLKAQETDLRLHFPPEAISDLKQGDRITVHLAFAPAGQQGTRAFDVPEGESLKGRHDMTGKVSDIDRDKGMFSFESHGQQLRLQFPPDQVRNLQDDQEITLTLGYKKAGGQGQAAGQGQAS